MDSITDNSLRTLWGIVKTAGTPDYLANGALVDANDAAALPDASFADTVNRRFPLTDRANTFASAGYFAKTAGDCGYTPLEHEAVLSRIKHAAEVYGIKKDVEDMMGKIAESMKPAQEKVAADDKSNYCDPEHMGYPVFDKQGAEMANDFFTKHAYQYGHERRMEIARNIMSKCAEYGVKVSEQVRLSAGKGFPNRETLAENLFFRANELLDRGRYKMASELCKFAKEICICSDEDLDNNREGIFNAISGIDETTGIDDCYGHKFCAPEEVAFDITPDSIKELIDDAIPMGRETLSAKALADLPRALFEKVLPKESVDGMMEDGKISPKKLSITIIGLKSPESSHLLRTIKDFTDGIIDVEDNPESTEQEISGKLEDGEKLEVEKGDKGMEVKVEDDKDDKDDDKSDSEKENQD